MISNCRIKEASPLFSVGRGIFSAIFNLLDRALPSFFEGKLAVVRVTVLNR